MHIVILRLDNSLPANNPPRLGAGQMACTDAFGKLWSTNQHSLATWRPKVR